MSYREALREELARRVANEDQQGAALIDHPDLEEVSGAYAEAILDLIRLYRGCGTDTARIVGAITTASTEWILWDLEHPDEPNPWRDA